MRRVYGGTGIGLSWFPENQPMLLDVQSLFLAGALKVDVVAS